MGLLDDFASATGKVGMALGGGDPGLVNLSDQQAAAMGNRSLLNFGLSMLLNSGPSYMPHSLGQSIAAAMMDAQRVPEHGEREMLAAQQAAQEMEIKRGQLGIQSLTAQRELELLRLQLARLQGGDAAVSTALAGLRGGTGGAGGAPGYAYTGLAPIIVGAESGGDVNAKNPKSSATGPGQFIDSTWQGFLASPEGKGYTMADRSNPEAVNKAIAWNAGQNDQIIRGELNRPATEDELLASHLLGGKSVAAMAANPTANLAETLTTTMGSKELAQRAIANNGTILRPDMTNAEALASSVGFYRKPRGPAGTQYAARDTGTRTDATPGPAPKPPPATAATTTTEPETGAPVITTAVASQPATPQPGAAAPALSQQPAQQPPAPTGPAPDTPQIAAARAQSKAAAEQRLQVLQRSQDPDKAAKAAEILKDLEAEQQKLDAEARTQQYEQEKENRQHGRQLELEQQKQAAAVALEQQRQAAATALETQRAENELRKTREGTLLQDDNERLKEGRARATAASNNLTTIQQLRALEPNIGDTSPLMAQNPAAFDAIYNSLGLGTPTERTEQANRRVYSQIVNKMIMDSKPTGLGQISDGDRRFMMDLAPSLAQTHDGRILLLGMAEKAFQRQLAVQSFAEDFIHRPGNIGSAGPREGGKTLNEELQQRFWNRSIFDEPPALVKGQTEQNSSNYASYVNAHKSEPGVPFFGLSPDGKSRVLMMWDQTRPNADGTPRLVSRGAG